jgi:Arylsulfotransferase (ASST)
MIDPSERTAWGAARRSVAFIVQSMLGNRQRRLALVATSALIVAGFFGAGANAQPPAGKVTFSEPSLFPGFSPWIHDYVVRCNDGPVTVTGHASGSWRMAIGNHPFRSGDFSDPVPLGAGQAFIVTVRQVGQPQLYRYHVRCLPNNFPQYTFTHSGPVSPTYFSVDVDESFSPPPDRRYAIILDHHGVPIWWDHVPAWGSRVLPSGTILWFDLSTNQFEIHRLDGSLVRTLGPVGQPGNPHDLQLLGNGDYLVDADVFQHHVDTSPYGGSSDATVANAELQEVGPGGQLLWDWKSQDHISLAETGHRWPWVINHGGYDILHWNSIEPDGNSVIASFRHLDAVYKIRKSTGAIVWKLGGTQTPQSLTVKNDPRGVPLGAQHDARVLSDGTLTVFDNRTNLDSHRPRAVRFRIDRANGTATLLDSITDPQISGSNCCGSARRLGNGDWLIDWGLNKPIGGYKPNGRRTFLLTFDSTFSYRAEPVPTGVAAQDLRQGMDAMSASP